MKTYQKFGFLIVIIVLAFFARGAYPEITTPATTSTASLITVAPPLLVLSSPSGPDVLPSSSAEENNTTNGNGPTASSVFRHTGNARPPALSDKALSVADLANGTIFAGINTDKRWPTASITKLMTASIVLDNIDPSARITITPEMMAADPQEVTLAVGGSYTVIDLLHVLLMPSSNVAAEAMADYYGKVRFMDAMNARALAWGMNNTYFDDPSGISAANQSTAADMLTLAQHVAKEYPQIFSITRTAQTTITELNSGRKVPVKIIKNFAGEPDFLGGKTGHTYEANGNLLSIFQFNGQRRRRHARPVRPHESERRKYRQRRFHLAHTGRRSLPAQSVDRDPGLRP